MCEETAPSDQALLNAEWNVTLQSSSSDNGEAMRGAQANQRQEYQRPSAHWQQ